MISDREGDIYEQFACCPADVDQIVRACQNRRIAVDPAQTHTLLFPFIDSLPEQGRLRVTLPAVPARKARAAELAVRFSPIVLQKPLHGAAAELPRTVALFVVDVRETALPDDAEPVHWRLLTTHAITTVGQAHWIVDLYRMRWTIEEFFRTLKTAGFNIENADIGDPKPMINLVGAATIAAVTVMQLVRARDGTRSKSRRRLRSHRPTHPGGGLKRPRRKHRPPEEPASQRHPRICCLGHARLGGWTGY